MELTTKNKIIIAVVYSASLVAVGRHLTPVKVKTEIKTVEIEKKTEKTDTEKKVAKKTKKVVEEKISPDGHIDRTTTITDDSTINDASKTASNEIKDKTEEKSKEVTQATDKVTISALAGVNVLSPSNGLNYGLSVTKPIFGPFVMGVFGFSNGLGGVSLGLSL